MLAAVQRRLRLLALRKDQPGLGGFTWPFVVSIDVALVLVAVIAAAQRPSSQWWIGAVAVAVACSPWIVFLLFNVIAFEAIALWTSWTLCIAILLFATSTPIEGDFAPLLLSMLTGVVGSVAPVRGRILATGSALALLGIAAATHRIETPALYLSFLGIGWLVGYLMRIQQQLLIEQRRAQEQLSEHAAADERRRIAREVHDVIAHSLSVTLLHITGARRGLQVDRDVDDAVESLEQAERLGRQAMADIRRTVGLLDGAVGTITPEPGLSDIRTLVDDFVRAGLNVKLNAAGRADRISAATGLALYRIAQESLANVAKHAPDAPTEVTLEVSRDSVTLTVANQLPVPVVAGQGEGRGLRGMRQRVELLGGTIGVGPAGRGWEVRAVVPLDDEQADRGHTG
ncbi:MAG: two-component sensor histidine kinase [Mycobacterium sp.]|nr:two-component sensor histidine kinase [Mycobacterium sp.]